MQRIPVVGVMGSGTEPHAAFAAPLGAALARFPVHLLTGGGGGVMTAVAQAFVEAADPPQRPGLSLGVIPAQDHANPTTPKPGYPNPFVELAIRTHLPSHAGGERPEQNRNPINVLTADVVIALPGSAGARQEVALAAAYGRPLALFGPEAWLAERPERAVACRALAEVEAFVRATLRL